jgi:hypothetical protein
MAMNETPKDKVSDEQLMLVFSQGSTEAFSELFRRYKQPIYVSSAAASSIPLTRRN